MEVIRLEIAKEKFELLIDSDALKFDEVKIIGVNEKDFDYSENNIWKSAKEKSDKAYKELKRIEFEIRHKL